MSEFKKRLRIERIDNKAAARLLDRNHPLGSGHSFLLALGIFWDASGSGKFTCEGVMTFGNPISNVAVQRYGITQRETLELRKMWCTDVPEKNAESRSLAIAIRLLRKAYPALRLLVTYCDGDDKAAAYKAAGWIPQQKHRYVREVFVDGKWYSIRDANRHGLTQRATERRLEERQKWVYILDSTLAPVVQSSTPTAQVGDGGSRPTPALHISDRCETADAPEPDQAGAP